ncbi:MAG: hypothetical protein JWL77_4124 [Chthonomonadaceae bacterium]|nr:hypothetical protein [Chthonomonadaceae bacterium]
MTDTEIAELMETQYLSIFENRDELAAACQTFAQLNQFIKNLNQANLNALQSRQRIFAVNEERVRELFGELTVAQQHIEASLANLHNIAGVLNSISSGVQIALQLLKPPLAVAAIV